MHLPPFQRDRPNAVEVGGGCSLSKLWNVTPSALPMQASRGISVNPKTGTWLNGPLATELLPTLEAVGVCREQSWV